MNEQVLSKIQAKLDLAGRFGLRVADCKRGLEVKDGHYLAPETEALTVSFAEAMVIAEPATSDLYRDAAYCVGCTVEEFKAFEAGLWFKHMILRSRQNA